MISWRVTSPRFPGEHAYAVNPLRESDHYFPPGMLNPWHSKHHVSEPAENSTSGNEDQNLRGGKRHKLNADRDVGNHKVMKPALPANPNPITIKAGSKVGNAEAPPPSGVE